MKTFSYDKLKGGALVKTEAGYPVTIYAINLEGTDYPIVGIIQFPAGDKVTSWNKQGFNIEIHNDDLVVIPSTRQAWINIYFDRGQAWAGEEGTFATQGLAQLAIDDDNEFYVKSMMIHEWEE